MAINQPVTATIDANDETCGPIVLQNGQRGIIHIDYTSGTISLEGTADGSTWLNIEDYTADTYKQIDGPGTFRLRGSSTPDADCILVAK